MKLLTRFQPREQALIGLALLLGGLFIIWQFLISPALAYNTQAQRSLENAARDHALVRAGLPVLSIQKDTTSKPSFDQNAAVQCARRANVSIKRVQPASDGALQIWLDSAPAASVYTFINELEGGYNVSIQRAQISREDGGIITAQFTFAPRK